MSGSLYVDRYRKSAITGSSPLQLVVMLYDGALRYMDAGRAAIATGDLKTQNEQLQKAQKVIGELSSCLDMKRGGEIAKNLLGLYTFAYNRLVEANVTDDPTLIDDAYRIMVDLRLAWMQIEQEQRSGGGQAEERTVAA